MSAIAVEIADVGLRADDDSGRIGSPSPGYALLDRGEVVVGETARASSRLKPRFVSHRFWDGLDRRPVGKPFPRSLTHADLVYAHLSRFWQDVRRARAVDLSSTSVLLAVPPTSTHDQLGLLLGVARACDMPVTGLVDSAVAALADEETAERVLYLDLYLHRAVWTLVESGERVVRRRVESVDNTGLLSFQQAWVGLLAAEFVRQTRFDPLHAAASEQALYDSLPRWIRQLEQNDGEALTLQANGHERAIEVTLGQLADAAESRLEAILTAARDLVGEDGAAAVALSSRADRIPGLRRRLEELAGDPSLSLAPDAATRGTLTHRHTVDAPGTELPLILGLPRRGRHG